MNTISRMKAAEKKHVYKIMFVNEAEGLLFGEKTTVVVDPSEERLQNEFAGVARTYIPMHAVIRIDEVEKRGVSKIHAVEDKEGKVHRLPSAIYTPVKRE